jgi:TonB-linked SusC/RagA family outer membrane protein
MRKAASLLLMLVLSVTLAIAQNRAITGTVTDESGNPVAFASVKVKDGKGGTSADANGNFKIEVKDGTVLIFSAAGSQTKEVTVTANQTKLTITLAKGNTELTSVVVSALNIKRSAKSTPYAVQTITSANLAQARETDLANTLAGKVAGAQIQGQAGSKLGAASEVRLRGVGDLNDIHAIYIVDGTIITNVTDINMDDVETVTVLKGRSATALYGGRAEGGVILITTKKARKGRPLAVDVTHSFSAERVGTLPKYQNSYAGGDDGGEWHTYTYTAGQPAAWQQLNGKRYHDYTQDASWGPKIDGGEYIPWYGWYTGETATSTPQENNVRDFFNTGITNNTNVSLSKGFGAVTTRLSYNYLNRTGIVPNTDQIKHYISTQDSWDIIKDRLTLGLNATYTDENIKGDFSDGYGNFYTGSFNSWFHRDLDMSKLKQYRDLRTPTGAIASWNKGSNPSSATTGTTADFNQANYWYNPYTWAYNNIAKNHRTRLLGDLSLKYKIMKDWDITGTYRVNYRKTTFRETTAGILESSGFQTGTYSGFQNDNTKYKEYNAELISTYRKSFGDFSIDALAGGNYLTRTQRDSSRATDQGLTQPDVFTIANSVGAPILSAGFDDKRVWSVFGRATLSFRDFIFLDGSVRRDWSSYLPVNNNGFTYGSAGVSFVFSDFLKNAAPGISYGKIRFAVASIGTDENLSPYSLNPFYSRANSNIPYGNYYPSTTTNTIVDPNIKPAINTEYELGLEMRFFKNRFGLVATAYKEDKKNAIVQTSIEPASGFTIATINAGLVKRKGIELQLDGNIVKTKNLSWDVTLNWAMNTSDVIKISDQSNIFSPGRGRTNRQVFASVVVPQVYDIAGQKWGQLRGTGIKRINGQAVLNNDGTYVAEQNVNFGSVLPNYTGGGFTRLTFKRISLAASFDYQQGGKYFSLSNFFGTNSGLYAATAATNDRGHNVRDAVADGGGVHVFGVKADGKPYDTYVDAYDYFHQPSNSGGIADESIFDASYIKIREVSLSYSLPVAKWNKLVKRADLSIIARNPWLIWATNRDIDPSELSNLNGEEGQLPGVRSYGATLKLGF